MDKRGPHPQFTPIPIQIPIQKQKQKQIEIQTGTRQVLDPVTNCQTFAISENVAPRLQFINNRSGVDSSSVRLTWVEFRWVEGRTGSKPKGKRRERPHVVCAIFSTALIYFPNCLALCLEKEWEKYNTLERAYLS